MRDSGIFVVGEVPWGSHLCQFYHNKVELLDVLVPYFKAGLEGNEYCLWITSEDVSADEARSALHEALPDGERDRLYTGQLEILDYAQWYLQGGSFDPGRIIAGWMGKLLGALDSGYEGLRAAGSASSVHKKDWARCIEYEETIDRHIGRQRILGLCSYRLDRCGGLEVVDVTRTHHLALFPQGAGWRVI
jgi:hypothetical protein